MNDIVASLRQSFKPMASRLGLSSNVLWRGIALSAYRRKRNSDPDYRGWLLRSGSRWVADHWGTTAIRDEVTWEHTASQLYELMSLLKMRGCSGANGLILDAGASDGCFLSMLEIKQGIGINFLKVCAKKILADGYRAILANVENLPFRDHSFSDVICLETLEHVQNPIATLKELGRVCSGRIYLSIPWIQHTRINSRPPGWPDVESHVFEFSEADFKKILTHTNLTIRFSSAVQVFPEPRNPLVRWWLAQWMYPSYFPRLQFYELEPLDKRIA